ncbi:MAG TPA: SpoIID/LytB domain-containing protein, partial [bacterium]|nr:SpoIID/LytB domain-containing protein [bacterium]
IQMSIGRGPAVKEAPQAEDRVETLDGLPLRVLLRRGRQGLKVSCPGGLRLVGADGRTLAELPPLGRARLGALGGRIAIDGKDLGGEAARILPLQAGTDVRVAGRRYRGRLWLKAVGGQLALVNQVGLEDYLKGVLPSEIPASWPVESLKAQAVAARSFALAKAQKGVQEPWDLDDSTSSQAYNGADGEQAGPNDAVDATRGRVLSWHNAVVEAYFHSNSGGHTADASEVWGGQAPAYLRGEEDEASEDQPHYAWSATVPMDTAQHRLEAAGLWKGFLGGVEGRERSDSGRWISVELLGGGGVSRVVSANAFRMALGADHLRSTNFKVRQHGDDLDFEGLGWGHGVGLSQEGARVLAQQGRDYRGILEHYYPGTRLAQLRW